MKIVLVDGDAQLLAQTARLVKSFLAERGLVAEVSTFASAEEFEAVRPSDLMLKVADGSVRVALRDLVLFEAAGHHVIVHVADGRTLIVRQPLQDLWERLKADGSFARLGRHSIVGLAHVTRLTGTTLTLDGGVKVSVSRRSLVSFRDAFATFCGA